MKILCNIHNEIKKILVSDKKISNYIWALPLVLVVMFIALRLLYSSIGVFFVDAYLNLFFIFSTIYCIVFNIILKLKDNEKIKNSIECITCILFLITIIYFLILSPILLVAYALLHFYSKQQDDDPFELIDSVFYIQIVVLYFFTMYFILLNIFQENFHYDFVKYFIINLIVFIVSFVVKFLYRKFKLKNAKSLYLENIHLFLMLSLFLTMFAYGNICQFEHYEEFNNACSALSLFITAITKKYN